MTARIHEPPPELLRKRAERRAELGLEPLPETQVGVRGDLYALDELAIADLCGAAGMTARQRLAAFDNLPKRRKGRAS